MECKRVFILGAGFSKPAGMPLATDLTDQLLESTRLHIDDDEQGQWIQNFQRRRRVAGVEVRRAPRSAAPKQEFSLTSFSSQNTPKSL